MGHLSGGGGWGDQVRGIRVHCFAGVCQASVCCGGMTMGVRYVVIINDEMRQWHVWDSRTVMLLQARRAAVHCQRYDIWRQPGFVGCFMACVLESSVLHAVDLATLLCCTLWVWVWLHLITTWNVVWRHCVQGGWHLSHHHCAKCLCTQAAGGVCDRAAAGAVSAGTDRATARSYRLQRRGVCHLPWCLHAWHALWLL